MKAVVMMSLLAVGPVLAPMSAPLVPAQATVGTTEAPGALLRGLDKAAGVSSDIRLGVGESVIYGRLTITLSDCRQPADNPAADAFAHLVIRDERLEEPVFRGWMVASSPALNAMDHPRYDVWVIRCTSS